MIEAITRHAAFLVFRRSIGWWANIELEVGYFGHSARELGSMNVDPLEPFAQAGKVRDRKNLISARCF
jgi:hypothetical protein